MFGKLSHSKIRASALGTPLNSSVYGQVIKKYYGRTRGPLAQIWAKNFRKGSSGKKGKKAGKKGAPPTYIENVDFMIGENPIFSPLRFWANENDEYPLDFDVYSEARVAYASSSFTIPDASFYCLIAVTLTATFSFDVDDFGGPGAATLTGTEEIPLWNFSLAGPDLSHNASEFYYPFCYGWKPGSAASVEIPGVGWGAMAGTFNFYYAKLRDGKVPTAQLRLTFEPVLGDGPEYSGFEDQQILYPHCAGLGSPNFDCGVGAQPNVSGEFVGAFPIYKDGDCDFVDIIQDIFKGGMTQAGLGTDQSYSPMQHGLNCYNLPGMVQSGKRGSILGLNELTMPLPVTAGNFLIVFHSGFFSSPSGCTDTAGTVFTEVFNGNLNSGFSARLAIYVGQVPANTQDNVVTITGAGGNDCEIAVFEIGGADSLDTFTVNQRDDSHGSGEITSASVDGRPAYLFALTGHNLSAYAQPEESASRWQRGPVGQYFFASDRRIQHPGTFAYESTGISTSTVTALFSFTNSQPVSYPRVFGDILEPTTLSKTRQQCRVYGLWGSLCMDSQKKASEWIDELVMAANAAPVWSGFSLKLIPRCEVSGAGNGGRYTAPTAAGPIADLGPDDMIADSSGQCVTIEHASPQVDDPNILQMQHPNRGSDYNDVVTAEPVAASIAMYGPRKESPKNVRCIQDTAVARKVLSVEARRQSFLPDTFKFTLQAKWKLSEPMDLFTLTDPIIGLDHVPVRITSIEEDEKFALKCEAEPFYYGLHLPGELEVTATAPYKPGASNAEPPSINDPIIFEAIERLNAGKSGVFLWFGLSGAGDTWGGCNIYASPDGVSYAIVGTQIGETTMGVTTAPFAGAGDPDTTGDLAVDVSESNGELESFSVANEDNFVSLCYVEGGSADVPYELISYAIATLTGDGLYTISGTSGNKIRRGVYSTPISTHASGKKFALLDNVSKLLVDPTWIGKTVYFKFPSFNSFFAKEQSLSDCTAYSFFIPVLSAVAVYGEEPTGAIDGVNTSFGISYLASPPFSLMLFLNGLLLRQGTDYTLTGSAITLATAPSVTDWLYACYRTDGNTSSYDDSVVPTGAIDGVNAAYTLPHAPNPTDSLLLYRNGVLQIQGTDYTLSSATATMSTPPNSGDWLIAWFRRDGVTAGAVNAEIPTGTIDSSNTSYALSLSPSPAASLMLFRNQILMLPGVDYVAFGTAIATTAPPQTGDSLVAFYRV